MKKKYIYILKGIIPNNSNNNNSNNVTSQNV